VSTVTGETLLKSELAPVYSSMLIAIEVAVALAPVTVKVPGLAAD
jgi:hypothetical protein